MICPSVSRKGTHCAGDMGHDGQCHREWVDRRETWDYREPGVLPAEPVSEFEPPFVFKHETDRDRNEIVEMDPAIVSAPFTKNGELTKKLLAKAGDNEPLFILRAQDESAVSLLRTWLIMNPQIKPYRRAEVERCILAMKFYPRKKKVD